MCMNKPPAKNTRWRWPITAPPCHNASMASHNVRLDQCCTGRPHGHVFVICVMLPPWQLHHIVNSLMNTKTNKYLLKRLKKKPSGYIIACVRHLLAYNKGENITCTHLKHYYAHTHTHMHKHTNSHVPVPLLSSLIYILLKCANIWRDSECTCMQLNITCALNQLRMPVGTYHLGVLPSASTVPRIKHMSTYTLIRGNNMQLHRYQICIMANAGTMSRIS